MAGRGSKGNEERYSANVKIKFLPSRLFLKQILYLFTVNNYANGCKLHWQTIDLKDRQFPVSSLILPDHHDDWQGKLNLFNLYFALSQSNCQQSTQLRS